MRKFKKFKGSRVYSGNNAALRVLASIFFYLLLTSSNFLASEACEIKLINCIINNYKLLD